MKNGIAMLENDHRELEGLFAAFEACGRGRRITGGSHRRQLVHLIREALAAHAEVERVVLYPRLRQVLPGGDPLADAALREHEELEAALDDLERARPGEATLDRRMAAVIHRARRHIAEEESSLLLHLDERLPEQQLEELGEQVETKRRLVPEAPLGRRRTRLAGR